MYAETGLMFPYFDNYHQQVQPIDDFFRSQKPNASLGIPSSLIQTSTISDYYLGGEGDLFNAPEPVIEEPLLGLGLDPIPDAISMISCGENVISAQSMTLSDIESSIESGQLLSEVFYECKKDILAKEGNETPLSEVLNITFPNVKTDKTLISDGKMFGDGILQKSSSTSCLRSIDCLPEASPRQNFLDFPVLDLDAVYGMRRAFSDGDIKTLGIDNTSIGQSNQSAMLQPIIMSGCISEKRKEMLSRYWNKKSKRNFGRKIKVTRSFSSWIEVWLKFVPVASLFISFETNLGSGSDPG